jgi:hypothetical protein
MYNTRKTESFVYGSDEPKSESHSDRFSSDDSKKRGKTEDKSKSLKKTDMPSKSKNERAKSE